MKLYFYLFILAIGLFSCDDDNSLIPSETPEFGYSVPQGNHDYDERIVDWNKRCNTFILYKFDLKELYWLLGMKRDISEFVTRCLICQRVKAKHHVPSGLLQLVMVPE